MIKDIWLNILLHLDYNSLKLICCANHLINNLLKDNYFWLQYNYNNKLTLPLNKNNNWMKNLYFTLQTNDYINYLTQKLDRYRYLECELQNYELFKNIHIEYIQDCLIDFYLMTSMEFSVEKKLFEVHQRHYFHYLDMNNFFNMIYNIINNNFKITKDKMPKLQPAI